MPQIMPLRGLRYTDGAGDPAALIAPPYDVISAQERDAIAERSPYNSIRLEFAAGGEERYDAVAALLEQWQSEGVLARDPEPMYYVYQQSFTEAGRHRRRTALLAGVEAQPWEQRAVLPHEYTMSGPKEDRLKLLKSARTQLSPLFMIARDRAGQLHDFLGETTRSYQPAAVATDSNGVEHRLWAVEASRYEARQLAPLLSESFYLADGHHRYETAVAYKQWRLEQDGDLPRDHPARFVLAAIVPAEDPGLIIRPIHRLVHSPVPDDWRERIERLFTVTPLPVRDDTVTACDAALEVEPHLLLAAGLEPGEILALRLRDEPAYAELAPRGHVERWTHLAVHLCRYGVLQTLWGIGDEELRAGAVEFHHDTAEVLDAVDSGRATAAFLLPHVPLTDVLTLSDQDERMPQKTTFFYPKMGTGFVFHPLDE